MATSMNINTVLIKGLSRGGFLHPSTDMVNLVINNIAKKPEIFSVFSQRLLVFNSILASCENKEVSIPYTLPYSNVHEPFIIIKMALHICTNVLLNNFCFKRINQLMSQKLVKKRKLQTLS